MKYFVCLFLCLLFSCSTKTTEPINTKATPDGFITEEFLLKNNFIKDEKYECYRLKNVKLSKVMALLGFEIADMNPEVNQPSNNDERWVEARNFSCNLESKAKDSSGRVIDGSLDDPESICDISVTISAKENINGIKESKDQKRSSFKLNIEKISESNKLNKPLIIELSIESIGNFALRPEFCTFRAYISKNNQDPEFVGKITFIDTNKEPIVFKDKQKIYFKSEVTFDETNSEKTWRQLANGIYVIKIIANCFKNSEFNGKIQSNDWSLELPLKSK